VAAWLSSRSRSDTAPGRERLTPLSWRVLVTNKLVLFVAPIAVGFVAGLRGRFAAGPALIVAAHLLLLWVLNFYLLRGAFAPLRKLSEFADRVDLLHPGRRGAEGGRVWVRVEIAMAQRISSPLFVGRSKELAVFERLEIGGRPRSGRGLPRGDPERAVSLPRRGYRPDPRLAWIASTAARRSIARMRF
jgi:hypothetical protein